MKNIRTLLSIENDYQWAVDIQTKVPRAIVKYVNTGPVNPGGGPKDESKKNSWCEYYNSCKYRHVDPDLVLVDGRWRVACALTAALECPNAIFLIHDFKPRVSYHVLYNYFDVIEEVETLIALRVKPNISREEVLNVIEQYKYRAE